MFKGVNNSLTHGIDSPDGDDDGDWWHVATRISIEQTFMFVVLFSCFVSIVYRLIRVQVPFTCSVHLELFMRIAPKVNTTSHCNGLQSIEY